MRNLASIFGDVNQSETLFEIKPPLAEGEVVLKLGVYVEHQIAFHL